MSKAEESATKFEAEVCQIENAYSVDAFRESAHRVVDLLADHLEQSLYDRHEQSLPWMLPEESMEHLSTFLDNGGSVEAFTSELLKRSVRISDPKFMGHQICSPAPASVIASLVVDSLNNGSGVYEMGMAGTAMEKCVVRWVADAFGMPSSADGFMTSGGTLANLTAMLAARAAKSGRSDWSEGTQQPLAVLVSEQAHYCVDRAVRIMGWGDKGIVSVPVDEHYHMRTELLPDLLHETEAQGRKVIAVVGSACTTSTGSFDDLAEIAKFCRENDLWFHVDGAHGAAVAFSKKQRHLVSGIEQADSVVIDFHKMMMTPVLSSALVFKDTQDSFSAFNINAEYLFSKDSAEGNEGGSNVDLFNLAKRTFECTKPMLSAKIFATLSAHGPGLFEANIDRLHALKDVIAEKIDAHPELELAVHPETNILCFRFVGTKSSSDSVNQAIRERLRNEGEYYIVQTVLGGETWLRTTIANPFSKSRHFDILLDKVVQAGRDLG